MSHIEALDSIAPPHECNELCEHAEQNARNIACDLELIDTLIPDALRFTHILDRLRESNLLASQIERVKNLFAEDLGEFGNELSPEVWEMLTVMELFDVETAWHCVNTYSIAKEKVETVLFSGIVLADSFKDEGVQLKQFYVSCLLHDVGKVEVPHSVVVNKVGDSECADLLYEHREDTLLPTLREKFNTEKYTLPENVTSGTALNSYLNETFHIRPQEITPVGLLLHEMSPEKRAEVEQQLSHCGHTLESTLLDVMRTHDAYSREILENAGFRIEAILAGAHHKNKDHTYKITIGAIQVAVDLADIIHLADVENAYMSARHYKGEHTNLQALKVLALHADRGLVDDYIAYLWIADTLHKKQDTFDLTEESERADYAFITNFLDTQLKSHLGWPAWSTGLTERSV